MSNSPTLYRMITSILLLPIKEKPILTLITNIIRQKMWEYDGIANWIEIITTMILIPIIGQHQKTSRHKTHCLHW